MNEIGAAVVQSAKAAAVQHAGKAVDYAINRVLDAFFGSEKEYNRKFMDDYHNHMLEIIDKNEQSLSSTGSPRIAGSNPIESAKAEIGKINTLIEESVNSLDQARSMTRCSVCKSDIEEALQFVNKKTNHVRNAGSRILAMTVLKERGELPPGTKWDDLTPKQRKLIDSLIDVLPEEKTTIRRGSYKRSTKLPGKKTTGKKTSNKKTPRKKSGARYAQKARS